MSPLRVLVIEDDPAYSRLLQEILVDAGDYRTDTAGSLAEAANRLHQVEYDIVLLDLNLEDVNGTETVVRFRELNRSLPVVILSGQDDVDIALEAMRKGAEDYLVKGQAEEVLIPRALRYAMERKRIQDFEQLLLGFVSHDLRNPLNAVALAAQMLSTAQGAAEREELVAHITQASERANELVATLLDVTRVKMRGVIPVHPQVMDLGEMASSIVQQMRVTAPDADIQLKTRGNLQGIWDESRLQQVLQNLIGNAVQHGETGSPVVVEISGADDSAEITVTNRGTIPASLLVCLFDPLKRSALRNEKPGQSVGLGLFIAQQIVHAHGGTLEADSGAGKTKFAIRVPRKAPVPV